MLQLSPWHLDRARWSVELGRHLPADFFSRDVDRTGWDDTRRAKLVVGPRQAGKSTLVSAVLAERPPSEVLFLHAEEERVRAWCRSSTGFLADLTEKLPSVRTIFVQEAQQLDDAGLFIKGLIDAGRGLDVIATGSGAFHPEARTRESLAGRATRRRLLPLSVGEIATHEALPSPAAERSRRGADLPSAYPAQLRRHQSGCDHDLRRS